MVKYLVVRDAGIDAGIVEEEYAFAGPILNDCLDQRPRKPLVTERINETECRYQLRFFKKSRRRSINSTNLNLRLVPQIANIGQLSDFVLERIRVFFIGVVEKRDKTIHQRRNVQSL